MKVIDERERQQNKGRKEQRYDVSYSESVRAISFCSEFKLGFL